MDFKTQFSEDKDNEDILSVVSLGECPEKQETQRTAALRRKSR